MKSLLGLLDVWDLVEKGFKEKTLKEEVKLDRKHKDECHNLNPKGETSI